MKLLQSFGWESGKEFLLSLNPSGKYNMGHITIASSLFVTLVDRIFGLDVWAFAGFMLMMFAELGTGIKASVVKGVKFESNRLSRFSFKFVVYLTIVGICHLMSVSFMDRHKGLIGGLFDWLELFLIVHIFFENLVSVLENISVIDGKDKSAWIVSIRNKINSVFK